MHLTGLNICQTNCLTFDFCSKFRFTLSELHAVSVDLLRYGLVWLLKLRFSTLLNERVPERVEQLASVNQPFPSWTLFDHLRHPALSQDLTYHLEFKRHSCFKYRFLDILWNKMLLFALVILEKCSTSEPCLFWSFSTAPCAATYFSFISFSSFRNMFLTSSISFCNFTNRPACSTLYIKNWQNQEYT